MGEEMGFEDGMDEGIEVGMSMCDDCHINTATVHLTHVERNEAHTFHLCEECARGRGVPIPDEETLLKGLETIVGNAVAALAGQQLKLAVKQAEEEKVADPEAGIGCSSCGMKLTDFRATGRLGCAGCYGSFEEQVERLLLHIHGFCGHKGKKYGTKESRGGKREVERLQRELNEAISAQRFEQAAIIRDAIIGIGQGAR